jgi:thioredoxin 1
MNQITTLDGIIDHSNGFTSLTGKSVVLDFYADWCGPCKVSSPSIEKLSKELTDIDFYKINVDESPEIAQLFNVMGIPTFVLITTDSKTSTTVGWQGEDKFKKFILE